MSTVEIAPGFVGAQSRGLTREDFQPLTVSGWGDGFNSYAHSMTWFKDRLYVGAARANLHLIRRRKPAPEWPVYPVNCPDDPFTLDLRAQIWRWDPRDSSWENVHKSPIVMGSHGKEVPREIGFRGMTVFQGPSDEEPVLYVTSFSPTRGPGPMVFRSEDGGAFVPCSAPGFGLEGISAFRSLVPFKGRLFTSPVGATQNRPNQSTYPMVFESADPRLGQWRPVSPPGFDNPDNLAVFEIVEFNGYLYAGTGNFISGFEIWKSDCEGEPPYRWTPVLRLGAYRGNLNEGVLSLCVFNNALYVGTAIQDGGYDRVNRIGPAAAEVIRINPDDTWDLVVGSSRLTPQGVKIATSGLMPGFNNFFNGYIWKMCVHDGCLYAGTWDWSTFLRYSAVEKWPQILREFVDALGMQDTIEREGGFDLMGTSDGDHWFAVTKQGFDNEYNCGVRTMVSTPYGLAVGTVNPFGPEVAVKKDGKWSYVDNPRGGLEVWLGSARQRPEGSAARVEEPLVVHGPAAVEAGRTGPVRRRKPEIDRSAFELTREQLEEMRKGINVQAVRADFAAFTYKYHHLTGEGLENLPESGSMLLACNHVGAPVLTGTSLMMEDGLLIAHFLQNHLGRPARILADPGYYDTHLAARLTKKTNEQLGCVPITLGNGVRLLEMGEPVVIYPEGQSSGPGYQTRPFFWGFAKIAYEFARMAQDTWAPIIPTVFIGPHESRPRIERDGKQIFINTLKPLPADYKFVFLPRVDVREHVEGLKDTEGLKRFCELIRGQIQAVLDREMQNRPLAQQALSLQEEYGPEGSMLNSPITSTK